MNESTALAVVVKSKSRESHGSWHEWEPFCLSLSFGPSVLAYLESKLPTFDSSAEVFALAILNRNGIKLDTKQYERLVRGLLHLEHWAFDPKEPALSVLANPASFEPLVKAVETEINRDAIRTAEKLLQYHSEKLTLPLHAKCASLAITRRPWGLLRLREQMKRMEEAPSYAEAVKDAATQIVSHGGKRPLLELVRETLVHEEGWEDVIWDLLCDDSDFRSGSDYEPNGQWLLDHGRAVSKHGLPIGEAAWKFLHDPRLRAYRPSEARQWLAILSDEFVSLPREELERVLLEGYAIHASAASALIARLGTAPAGFRKRDTVGAVPALSDSPSPPRPARSVQ
jgi:hypothetical protein